jgi:uroporphyrinogen decarboxylase
LTPKERVLTALSRREPDRVPVNYSANAAIDARLKRHFGLAPDDDEGLREALGVDFRGIAAPYAGPRLHADMPERGLKVCDWGTRRRWMEHETGGYWDFCEFPLLDVDEETIARWPMPSPDAHDYSGVRAACERQRKYAVYVGGQGLGCVMNLAGLFRGMEQVFLDLALDEPAGLRLIDRLLDIQFEVARRTLEAAQGGIDFMWIGEDLGTQHTPLISMDMLKKHILPRQRRFFELAKFHGIPVMLHTCGSSSWAYDAYIQMGLAAVDTLQPEATNMSPAYLKQTFGDRLAFHGCISTAGPVATGTIQEVRQSCRDTLEIMMPGGGYCFAPTHDLQDNSPTENVLAMYETARDSGVYRR